LHPPAFAPAGIPRPWSRWTPRSTPRPTSVRCA
jgi:hypothetical protein